MGFGPIFPEQQKHSTEPHRHFHDCSGALEALLANKLRDRGYDSSGFRVLPIK
jgi:hypothetical protein